MKKKTVIALVALLAIGQGAWADVKEDIGGITWNNQAGYYEIDSPEDLNDLAVYVNGTGTYSTNSIETTPHNCNGLTFMVTQNITFTLPVSPQTSNFTPIGIVEYNTETNTPLYEKGFQGTFNGGGMTISGVTVNNPSGEAVALFGNVFYPAVIKNVKLANSNFTGNYCVGGIVGEYNGNGENPEWGIYDCEVGSDVTVTAVTTGEGNDALPGWYAGGIVGMAGLITLSRCVSAATVFGDEYVGGITGQIYKDTKYYFGTLSDCYYTGSSVSGANGAKYVGKIVGLNGTEDDDGNYKDNSWNTLCLPFDASLTGDFAGAEIRTLSSATFEEGTLTLDFTETESSFVAGKPYIIKWTGGGSFTPTFEGVTINSAAPTDAEGTAATFHGIYTPYSTDGANTAMLYLGANNTLYYPSAAMTISAFRAYFKLRGGITAGSTGSSVRAFNLNFGGEASGIEAVTSQRSDPSSAVWYDLSGRKVTGEPTTKGIYVNNGRKVVIK